MSKSTHDEIMKAVDNFYKKRGKPIIAKSTKKETEAAAKRTEAAMKKAGCKTLDEYMKYVDGKRGY